MEYLHDDALGSIQSVSKASGSEQRSFTPFGSPEQGSFATEEVPYGFTGQEHDAEFGLINMHGRMYDPVLGQFLSPDPVMQLPYSQGFNRFAYAFNNPLAYVVRVGSMLNPPK